MSPDFTAPDFDQIIPRRGSGCMKWDALGARTGVEAPDGLAMWVADMDFRAPAPVLAALENAVAHGVFGYPGPDAGWREAVCDWRRTRHGWEIEPDWISHSAGVCAALGVAAQAFSAPGEGVAMFAPVYHQFAGMVRAAGRRPVELPLTLTQGRYEMDLEQAARDLPGDARIVLLCSPHNPGGRVWTREELSALGQFCAARGLILISDEIWCDLVYPGATHVPTAVACPEIADRLITCAAPSKTFNLAGLQSAEVIIADPALRGAYREMAGGSHAMAGNAMGLVAAETAYRAGADWLDALLPYLAANRDAFDAGLAEAVPGARPMALEATYLSWVDFSGTGLPQDEIARRLREDARIGVNAGGSFGPGGAGWMRFNFACPRATVDQALSRLEDAFSDLR